MNGRTPAKLKRCVKCGPTKIFHLESDGHYHCESCGSMLVETAVTNNDLTAALRNMRATAAHNYGGK